MSTPKQANRDRAQLIWLLEQGHWSERLWLPLIRWVHRRQLKKRG